MRRAMRHVHLLGGKEPLLWCLVPTLVQSMGQAFPELTRAEALITETLRLEETSFNRTLARGMRLLDEASDKLGEGGTLEGDVAFRLYDTYGFPLDLTQDILRGRGKHIDTAGFEACMAKQREEARKAWSGSGDATTETVWLDLREEVGATEFLGYATERAEGVVTGIVSDGMSVIDAEAGTEASLIVSQTPFYGESGGQVGDIGLVSNGQGAKFAVSDTQRKLGDMQVHIGTVKKGRFSVGDAVDLRVESGRRAQLRANHSVTHLMHEALRRALGDHVTQKGSLVAPKYLRFDFSHPKPVTTEELEAIEAEVNARIRANAEVSTRLMTPDDAVEAGALALFGEKYGEEVRVVAMGDDGDRNYSVELCGGTHVSRTGDIGYFQVTGESAVAAGVRRIEAVTGALAVERAKQQSARLFEVASTLKTPVDELPSRLANLLEERRNLEREISELRQQVAMGGDASEEPPRVKDIGGVPIASRTLDGVPAKELKPLVDSLKKQIGSGVVAVVSVIDGKASLVVGVTDDLTEQLNADDLVRAGSAAVGGKGGGGRPDMAQAGGPDGLAAGAAIAAIEGMIAEQA